jgi:peroxiredoxin
MLEVGDDAPDFPIGNESLASWARRGPVVVFFFPKAFTPG